MFVCIRNPSEKPQDPSRYILPSEELQSPFEEKIPTVPEVRKHRPHMERGIPRYCTHETRRMPCSSTKEKKKSTPRSDSPTVQSRIRRTTLLFPCIIGMPREPGFTASTLRRTNARGSHPSKRLREVVFLVPTAFESLRAQRP